MNTWTPSLSVKVQLFDTLALYVHICCIENGGLVLVFGHGHLWFMLVGTCFKL